ncbi:mesoderm posterior aa [Pempheris klunzingeri]|uniref:mesoderm posterior aa n=1 Tax=Pempheris klunzingeri TaxID=3127111 RepID=UPI00397F1978
MEVSYCSPIQLQENAFLFDCDSLLDKSCGPLAYDPASDPGYFSAGSSLSPTSSVDSFCFSPTSLQASGNEQDALDRFIFNSPAAPLLTHEAQSLPCTRSSAATSTIKKSRSRYPGKKRQTASEREKLRMRDLTKAMHHLRTYLPPSVAPAGQTLTKIETLRLTIRYISYLSAQLGLSDEVLEQKRSSGFVEQPQTLSQFLGQPPASHSPQEPDCNSMSTVQLSSLQPSYQVSGGVCFPSEQYWTPQQQLQHTAFCGQR